MQEFGKGAKPSKNGQSKGEVSPPIENEVIKTEGLSGDDQRSEDYGNEEPVTPTIEEIAKGELVTDDNNLIVGETKPQETAYLVEDSDAQKEALEEAEAIDKELVVMHDFGSSEWLKITYSRNDKEGYISTVQAMPIGAKGQKGTLIKTTMIKGGACSVHTLFNEKLRVAPDPKAPNLYILN